MGSAHIVEAGGRGGVYQHAVAVAEALRSSGVEVVLHTATDAELEPGAGVEVCRCVRWWRGLRPRQLRPPLIALTYLLVTLPHLARAVRRGDVYHFQGEFKSVLTTLGLILQRALPGRRVVQSRHNTFSRHGGSLDEALMRLDARVAEATVVFSGADERRVSSWGGRPVRSPLAQYLPPVTEDGVQEWRARWAGAGAVLLFAGQVRPDKRLDLLIEAAALLEQPVVVAVVGEDMGHAESCREFAARRGVEVRWTLGYTPLASFAAALRAADVVVCPYDRASQSGVLAVASTVGTVTVATDVGGLGELSSVTVPPGDPVALARGLERALDGGGRSDAPLPDLVVAAHLRAYAMEPPA
jgi:glycosyltransferase involved in cell wall biosynthesis